MLNLPRRITYTDGSMATYTYNSLGEKLQVAYATSSLTASLPAAHVAESEALALGQTLYAGSTDYLLGGSLVMKDGMIDKYLFDGGYAKASAVNPTTYSFEFHYYNRDHLGNNREVVDSAGVVEQVTHYYPYGAPFCERTTAGVNTNATLQRFKYNGKELDLMHGLKWYDYGARMYDPILLTWNSIDPLCEKYYSISPYAFCGNNPMRYIDPDGSIIIFINGKIGGGSPPAGEQYWGGKYSSFILNSQKVLNDKNILFYDQDHKYLSKAWEREKNGYEWAKSNLSLITENMAEGESVKIISHSMGGAFGKGVERFLKINGIEVEYNIMLNTYQIDQINNEDNYNTFYIDYKNTTDPVLFWFETNMGKGELKNADIIIRQPTTDTEFYYIHRFPIDNGKLFWDYMDFLINYDSAN